MILEILAKLVSESILSIYPTFVKNIDLSLGLQLWSRCFTYILISTLFIDWSIVYKPLFSRVGILLSLIMIVHIYTSYRGFQLLHGGIAYALFYTYPLMILLLSGEKIHYMMFIALLGVLIIYMSDDAPIHDTPDKTSDKSGDQQVDQSNAKYWGYIMIFIAAFTEAVVYFLIREIKTTNHWNHLFLSYALGALVFSAYYFKDILHITLSSRLFLSMGINTFIGIFGHLLRFFAISHLQPSLYAPLSYFSIIMASIYGYMFNGEIISYTKMVGMLCIVLSNLYIMYDTHIFA